MPQNKGYTLPQRDSQDRIREILAGLTQQEEQPGLAQRILFGIPQAISVLTSEKPGEALGEQIKGIIQTRTIEKERRNRLRELGATLEIEDIMQRAKESRAEEFDIRKGEREAKVRAEEFKATTKEQRKQLVLNNRFQKGRDEFQSNENRLRDIRQNRASRDLVELQARLGKENAFYAEVAKNSIDAIMSGHMDAKTAVDLYGRIANKEDPTPEDIKAINKAIMAQRAEDQRNKLALVTAEAKARNTGKTPMEAAQEFALEFSRRYPQMWILDVDGKEKLVPLNIEPLTQQPVVATGQKFLRNATSLEVQQKTLTDFMQMQGFSNPLNASDQSTETRNKTHAEAVVRNAIATRPFETVKQEALSPETLQGLGVTQSQMQEILVKVQTEEKQKTPATLDETEAELKEIRDELRAFAPEPGRGVALPRRLSDDEREQKRKLLERQVVLEAKKVKQATVKFIEDKLAVAEAQLSTSRTEGKKERLTKEIKDLKDRLKVAREGVNK